MRLLTALLPFAFQLMPATASAGESCAGESAGIENVIVVQFECESAGSHHGAAGGDATSDAEIKLEYPLRCDDLTGACYPNESYNCPEGETYVIVWGKVGESSWERIREGCEAVPDVSKPSVTPDMVIQALRRVGLPPLEVTTAPANQTLVNLQTVFSTSPAPVTRTLTLLGQSVEVEATPSTYLWHFGDGDSLSTNRPGSPYPAMDLTHRYAKAHVTVHPAVDTTYTARFRVNGGAWQDVDGTVTIVGPPATLEVLEATPVLSGNR